MPDWMPSLHTILEWVITWALLSVVVAALWAGIGWRAWQRGRRE